MSVRHPLLVIDDDAAITNMVATALADDGYAVEAVTSTQDALDRLAVHGPDGYCVVISDSFSRPPADPFIWLAELRTRTTAPVIVFSGYPEGLFNAWQARGFAAFLAKPCDIETLTALVSAHCGAP